MWNSRSRNRRRIISATCSASRLAQGVIESFIIRREGHEMCVKRAVDVVLRDEQTPLRDELTKSGQVAVEAEIANAGLQLHA